MKKLITALAVCAATSLSLAAGSSVTSANVVGFVSKPAIGKHTAAGSMFISVGATNTWKLGDVTVSGMDPTSDFIQFLNTANAKTMLSATYIDTATAISYGDASYQGWWNTSLDTRLDNTICSVGTGFLCNFGSSGVTFTYAGQVLQGSTTLDLSGLRYPMVANFTPVDLVLSNLTVTGMDPTADFIQFLSTTNAKTILSATYIDAATAISYGDAGYQGWWNTSLDTRLDGQPFAKGAAFLCNFSSPSVKIIFPDPMH